MNILNTEKYRLGANVVTFCVILSLGLLAGCRGGNRSAVDGSDWVQVTRVTSPDGLFDAVMIQETIGGSLGGIYWNVFIVTKGAPAPKNEDTIFEAAALSGEKLIWKQNHLLEIHYELAHIERFRNLWGSNEVHGRGFEKGDYLAEVRLAPSSPDFSFVTPDGGIKQQQ